MKSRYLLDTNTASYAIRGTIPSVLRRLEKLRDETLYISVMTEAELRFGIARKPEAVRLRQHVEQFLSEVNILPWISGVALVYAEERAALERRGYALDEIDMMIAAHALAEDCILVTSDNAFRRVDRLRVEDWAAL